MVLHFIEEHSGERQDFLMRITRYHKKAAERQILESIRILEGNRNPQESLNLKSEWAAARLPTISVKKNNYQPGNRREDKRVRYVEMNECTGNQEREEPGNSAKRSRDDAWEHKPLDPIPGRNLIQEEERKSGPTTFTEVKWRERGHSWSPGKVEKGEKSNSPPGNRKGRSRKSPEKGGKYTPVKVKIKRLERSTISEGKSPRKEVKSARKEKKQDKKGENWKCTG